jgi:hypothetical protein
MSDATTKPGLRAAANDIVERLANIKVRLISVSSKLEARPEAAQVVSQLQNAAAQSIGQKPQDATLPALVDSTGVAQSLVDDVEVLLQEIEALL